MIMLPVVLEAAWSLYVFDQLTQMVTVLDPMNTHSELADYVCKHKSVVHDMLRALGSIKLSLGGGWVHIGDDWEIVYNSCMHEPSTRIETGVYMLHYAREFDGNTVCHANQRWTL